MKFLLISPHNRGMELGPKTIIPVGAHLPPLGLLYLARMLEINGYEVEVLDLNAENITDEKMKGKILSSDAIGMTLYSGKEVLEGTHKLSKLIKEYDPDIPLLIGGPYCCYFPEKAIVNHHADICVKGEGEHVIIPIAEAIQGKRDFSIIPGIWYRDGDEIKSTKPPEQIKDLDSIPDPARHLVDKYDYGYISSVKLSNGKTTSILTSRGCSYNCKFCGLHYLVPGYRRRSIDNIKKEIGDIIDKGYNTLAFVDDNFLQLTKEAEKIMDFIIEKDSKIDLWIEQARIDSANRGLYQKMRDAGVKIIYFGIESGNQDVLDYYNKRITIQQIRNAIRLSKEMGFFISASFILGAPIETKEHIENTKKFVKSLLINHVSFYSFAYLIGSPLWEEAVKKGQINPEEFFVKPDIKRGLGNFTEKELTSYVNEVYKSYYFSPHLWMSELFYAFTKKDFRFLKLGLQLLRST